MSSLVPVVFFLALATDGPNEAPEEAPEPPIGLRPAGNRFLPAPDMAALELESVRGNEKESTEPGNALPSATSVGKQKLEPKYVSVSLCFSMCLGTQGQRSNWILLAVTHQQRPKNCSTHPNFQLLSSFID